MINRGWIINEFDKIFAKKKVFTRTDMIYLVGQIRPYIAYDNDYNNWLEKAKETINFQARDQLQKLKARGIDIIFPIGNSSIKVYHYWRTNTVRDNSNKGETIHDLLVDCNVIVGDNWQAMTPTHGDADIYRDEILDHITEINLTVFKW